MIKQRILILPFLFLLTTAKSVTARRNDGRSRRLAEPSYFGEKEMNRYLKGIIINDLPSPSSQVEGDWSLSRPKGGNKGKFRLLKKTKASKKDKTPKKRKSPKGKGKKNKQKNKQKKKRKQKKDKKTSQPTSSPTAALTRAPIATPRPTSTKTRAPIAVPLTPRPTSPKTRAPTSQPTKTDTDKPTNSPSSRQVPAPKPRPNEPILIPGPDDDLVATLTGHGLDNDDLTF